MEDQQLLKKYTDQADQAAFAQLVEQHARWIFSAARRQLGDEHLAEDVTQATFLLLATRAKRLKGYRYLSGWLFVTLGFCVKHAKRQRARTQRREQEAATMRPEEVQETRWDEVTPLLESAVGRLGKSDRDAVLLRFYEQKPLAEVGRALGVSEEAARKRVDRAVEKLRGMLQKQGVTATSAGLSAVLVGNAVQEVPARVVEGAMSAVGGGGNMAAGGVAKGALKTMAWAKVKVAAMVMAGTIAAAGATTEAIRATRPVIQPTASAATVPAGPAGAAGDVQAPPIRPGKQTVAVNRTIFALRQADTDKLIAASRLVSADQRVQSRVGSADALRPIISAVLAKSVSSTSLDWQSKYYPGFGVSFDSKQLSIGTGNNGESIYLESSFVVSSGIVTQIAGSVSISGSTPNASYAVAPFAIQPTEIRLQIIPVTVRRSGIVNLVLAYEAVPVDFADRDPLSQMTDAAAWFAQPRNKTLRIARAGAVWQSMVPESTSSAARLKGIKLPSGASIWVRSINDESVDPLAAWTAAGRPADVMRAGKPMLHVGVEDPNLPPFHVSNTGSYEGWPVVPLIHKSAEGYSCTIGYGDGKYKTVASLSAQTGATASFAGCTLKIESISDHGHGNCRLTGTLPKDTDFDLVAVLKDGSWRWNTLQYHRHVEEGKQPAFSTSFSFDTDLAQITHLEVRSRPLKWVTFERLAARPAVALPTGMEPPADRDEGKQRILAEATPADRKAFLDKVNCVRCSVNDGKGVKTDMWLWRDGRYRNETWTKDGHTLVLGDKKTAWSCDPQTGNWTEARKSPGREMGSFAEMMAQIGGMESVIALGETVGTEVIHGTACTIRTGQFETRTAKAWLDSLGIIHRFDISGGESAVIDYNPIDAKKAWTPPVAYASTQPLTRYEAAAEAFLAKAVPADKPIKSIIAAGRRFDLLSVKSIRDDLAIICTSTELLPESRKHRDDNVELWQATQMHGIGVARSGWMPRPIARLHMPYREITWWSLSKGDNCTEPDLADLVVMLGQASGSFSMESWIESQPNPTRMHQLAVDLLDADRVDLDAYLREVYQLFESYRKTVGEASSSDFVTASDSWEKFKQTADAAIAGREAISSSGR